MKAISKISVYIVIMISGLLSISCNDNTILNNTLPFSFDSSRFQCIQKYVPNFTSWRSFVLDTNQIFLVSDFEFAYYENYEFKRVPLFYDFIGLCITGKDKENIYIGGSTILNTFDRKARLLKWNGINLQEISLPDTSLGYENGICNIYCKSNAEIWFAERRGILFKYDGVNISSFVLDTNGIYQNNNGFYNYFVTDMNNKLSCVQVLDSENTIGTYSRLYIKFYQFSGNNFELVSTNTFRTGVYPEGMFPQKVGNEMLALNRRNGIFSFDGFVFNKILDISEFKLIHGMSGSSQNNLMIFGTDYFTQLYQYGFHWNGQKWSKETKGEISGGWMNTYYDYVKDMFVICYFRDRENESQVFFFKNKFN